MGFPKKSQFFWTFYVSNFSVKCSAKKWHCGKSSKISVEIINIFCYSENDPLKSFSVQFSNLIKIQKNQLQMNLQKHSQSRKKAPPMFKMYHSRKKPNLKKKESNEWKEFGRDGIGTQILVVTERRRQSSLITTPKVTSLLNYRPMYSNRTAIRQKWELWTTLQKICINLIKLALLAKRRSPNFEKPSWQEMKRNRWFKRWRKIMRNWNV